MKKILMFVVLVSSTVSFAGIKIPSIDATFIGEKLKLSVSWTCQQSMGLMGYMHPTGIKSCKVKGEKEFKHDGEGNYKLKGFKIKKKGLLKLKRKITVCVNIKSIDETKILQFSSLGKLERSMCFNDSDTDDIGKAIEEKLSKIYYVTKVRGNSELTYRAHIQDALASDERSAYHLWDLRSKISVNGVEGIYSLGSLFQIEDTIKNNSLLEQKLNLKGKILLTDNPVESVRIEINNWAVRNVQGDSRLQKFSKVEPTIFDTKPIEGIIDFGNLTTIEKDHSFND